MPEVEGGREGEGLTGSLSVNGCLKAVPDCLVGSEVSWSPSRALLSSLAQVVAMSSSLVPPTHAPLSRKHAAACSMSQSQSNARHLWIC